MAESFQAIAECPPQSSERCQGEPLVAIALIAALGSVFAFFVLKLLPGLNISQAVYVDETAPGPTCLDQPSTPHKKGSFPPAPTYNKPAYSKPEPVLLESTRENLELVSVSLLGSNLTLQARLRRAQADLARQQRSMAAAEAAAAKTSELQQQLEQELWEANNAVDSLKVQLQELGVELEAAVSELLPKDIAYDQLKASFFRLQHRYCSCTAELEKARSEVRVMQEMLEAAQAILAVAVASS